jgi:hypothetical protein
MFPIGCFGVVDFAFSSFGTSAACVATKSQTSAIGFEVVLSFFESKIGHDVFFVILIHIKPHK